MHLLKETRGRDKSKAQPGMRKFLNVVERYIKSYGRVTRNRVTVSRGETEGVLVAATCRQMGVVSAITMGVVLSQRVAAAPYIALRVQCICI